MRRVLSWDWWREVCGRLWRRICCRRRKLPRQGLWCCFRWGSNWYLEAVRVRLLWARLRIREVGWSPLGAGDVRYPWRPAQPFFSNRVLSSSLLLRIVLIWICGVWSKVPRAVPQPRAVQEGVLDRRARSCGWIRLAWGRGLFFFCRHFFFDFGDGQERLVFLSKMVIECLLNLPRWG